jgi:aryl-alcohol dehydrogenase-like predicted oxidoreductase
MRPALEAGVTLIDTGDFYYPSAFMSNLGVGD